MIGSYAISPVNAALLVGVLVLIWLMYRLNKSRKNTYDIADILMGPNNRASLTNHILLSMACLSGWVIIDMELDGKDVTTILTVVLGVFVAGKTITSVTDIINKKDDSAPPKSDKEKLR